MKISNVGNDYRVNCLNNKPTFKRNWSEHVSWGANYIKDSQKTNFKLFTFTDAKAVFVEVADKALSGLSNIKDRIVKVLGTAGAFFAVEEVFAKDDNTRIYPMTPEGNGVYKANDVDAKAGDQYRYIIVDKNNNINLVKDPYSKSQDGVHSWSRVYDSDNYQWKNTDWLEGKDPRRIVRKPNEPLRGLENLIIDEINIPTLTEEGNFTAAKKRIDVIANRGIATAIEIMPVENTHSKQWGYDGVDKFAVNERLGTPAQLKELIDYAHGKGLNVIMDMVPNHMGPDGDYLTQTGPYEAGSGQFGAKLNYEGKDNRYVRDWMANAALWWANEFKVDGIRFDMTKETASDYLMRQLVEELNHHNPDVFLIAEDGRNNKLAVTRYDETPNSHQDTLDFIDMNIEFISTRNWRSTPHSIGFDTEWDFPFMHTLKSAVINNNEIALNQMDEEIRNSAYRVKYAMSHDEIGNVDGTRLIPKVISQYLDFFNNIEGIGDADRGQKAAQLSQKLAEVVISGNNITSAELAKLQSDYGLTKFYDKKTITNAVLVALAKQRLATGTIMTLPGPKMYFQGDDNAEVGHFKFFRELSGDREDRIANPHREKSIIEEKGYDTIIDKALPDSVLGRVKPAGDFADVENQMIEYNKDLKSLILKNPALLNGNIKSTYKDHGNSIHIHTLEKDGNEIVVFKNFANRLYDGNYSTLGFPKEGEWVEIFNSDDTKYGGSGSVNKGKRFSDLKQGMNFAPHSIIMLKKVK